MTAQSKGAQSIPNDKPQVIDKMFEEAAQNIAIAMVESLKEGLTQHENFKQLYDQHVNIEKLNHDFKELSQDKETLSVFQTLLNATLLYIQKNSPVLVKTLNQISVDTHDELSPERILMVFVLPETRPLMKKIQKK